MDNCDAGSQYNSNCLICGQGLDYRSSCADLICFYCGKKEKGNIFCSSDKSHYVCDDCHNQSSFNFIKDYILSSHSTNPLDITLDILNSPSIPMLGCHHAYILAGSILAGLKNRGYIDITGAVIEEAFLRLSKQAVGGYCGLSGVCGITPAGGIVYSILTGSVCGKDKEQKITMGITAALSKAIYDLTGPSCCKAYLFKSLDLLSSSLYDDFGFLLMDNDTEIKCNFKDMHPHGCRLEKCPYFAGYKIKVNEPGQNFQKNAAELSIPKSSGNNKVYLNAAMLKNPEQPSDAPSAPC